MGKLICWRFFIFSIFFPLFFLFFIEISSLDNCSHLLPNLYFIVTIGGELF